MSNSIELFATDKFTLTYFHDTNVFVFHWLPTKERLFCEQKFIFNKLTKIKLDIKYTEFRRTEFSRSKIPVIEITAILYITTDAFDKPIELHYTDDLDLKFINAKTRQKVCHDTNVQTYSNEDELAIGLHQRLIASKVYDFMKVLDNIIQHGVPKKTVDLLDIAA